MLYTYTVYEVGRSAEMASRSPRAQLWLASGLGDSPCASIVFTQVSALDDLRLGLRLDR